MGFCLPFLFIAAGTGMQIAANAEAASAANAAANAELERQRGYQKRAQGVFDQSLAASTPQAAQQSMTAATEARTQDYAKQRSVPLSEGASPVADTQRLVSPQAVMGQDRLADAARARLAGYTEWDLQQAIKDMRASQQLGTIGNFAQGSQNVLPLELQDAARRGSGLRSLGQLFSLGGSLAAAYPGTAAPARFSFPVAPNASKLVAPSIGAGAPLWGNLGI